MCGILGRVEPRGLAPDPARLERARDALRHRGPDDARSAQDDVCHLGFRRLAILDLTDAGAQPMRSPDDAHWIVFNGEIYNHRELRAELEREGIVFRGHSDTEVLLALYGRRGRGMLTRLNGMFALAIYDRRRRTLLLARDRCGEKPLFLWRHARGLSFASEVRALQLLPGFPTEPDPSVLAEYFRLGFVPGHRCVWPGVFKLPPGSSVEYSLERAELGPVERYWAPPAPAANVPVVPEDEAVETIGRLLDDAVALRLRSDVPLGCFLSGGLDSSLVAESAARQSGRTVAALTVAFPGWGDNEEPIARETARRFGLEAQAITLDSAGLGELPEWCAHFDEPFADASLLPTSLVCREARRRFTVVLGGDGGDEAFGGYDNHVRAAACRWVDRVPAWIRRSGAALAAMSPQDSRLERMARRWTQPTGRWGLGAKVYPFASTFDRVLRAPVSAKSVCEALDEELGPVRGSALDESQRTDLRLYLPDDILVKTDRMSMRHSLEVRAPFLDHRLIEAGLALPPALRVSGGQGKRVLRRLAQRRGFPEAVWNGPKRGFGLPLRAWIFEGAQSAGLRRTFLGDDRADDGLLGRGALEQLWRHAERNEALVAPVFRVLAYRWWRQGLENRRAA